MITELEKQVVQLETKADFYEKQFDELKGAFCDKTNKILEKIEDLNCHRHHTDIEVVKVENKGIKSQYNRLGLYYVITLVAMIWKIISGK